MTSTELDTALEYARELAKNDQRAGLEYLITREAEFASHARYWGRRGMLELRVSAFLQAEESFTHAIRLHPIAASGPFLRAKARLGLAKRAEAYVDLFASVGVAPLRHDARLVLVGLLLDDLHIDAADEQLAQLRLHRATMEPDQVQELSELEAERAGIEAAPA